MVFLVKRTERAGSCRCQEKHRVRAGGTHGDGRSVGLSEWRVARYGKPRSVACRPAVMCLSTGERLVQRECLVRFGGGEGNVSAKNLELAIKVLVPLSNARGQVTPSADSGEGRLCGNSSGGVAVPIVPLGTRAESPSECRAKTGLKSSLREWHRPS